jgi:hypothetical protein
MLSLNLCLVIGIESLATRVCLSSTQLNIKSIHHLTMLLSGHKQNFGLVKIECNYEIFSFVPCILCMYNFENNGMNP